MKRVSEMKIWGWTLNYKVVNMVKNNSYIDVNIKYLKKYFL